MPFPMPTNLREKTKLVPCFCGATMIREYLPGLGYRLRCSRLGCKTATKWAKTPKMAVESWEKIAGRAK